MAIKYSDGSVVLNVNQTFKECIPDYELDPSLGILVQVGEINIYEKIQSNSNCALDKILDKFLEPEYEDMSIKTDQVMEIKHYDLIDLAELLEDNQVIKSKLKLSDNMSIRDVINLLKSKSVSKEVNNDEKKKTDEEK